MVTEYGMSARLGAVRYGREHGDPFLGRSMGNQADYSLEVAHEIDEEVRKLIEAAHTEAWDILNTYRDVLDDLVVELLDKETLTRRDLERIFGSVEKRPRITAFNDFGERTPSDKPPIKTKAELARERGEVWPPEVEREPAPVGSYPGGGPAVPSPGAGGHPAPQPGPKGGGYPGGFPAERNRNGHAPTNGNGTGHVPPPAGYGQPQPPYAVAPNYGAPPDWRPATTPAGQTWPPPNWAPHQQQPPNPRPQQGRPTDAEQPTQAQERPETPEQPGSESGSSH
jgi:cell division protease FtsH